MADRYPSTFCPVCRGKQRVTGTGRFAKHLRWRDLPDVPAYVPGSGPRPPTMEEVVCSGSGQFVPDVEPVPLEADDIALTLERSMLRTLRILMDVRQTPELWGRVVHNRHHSNLLLLLQAELRQWEQAPPNPWADPVADPFQHAPPPALQSPPHPVQEDKP